MVAFYKGRITKVSHQVTPSTGRECFIVYFDKPMVSMISSREVSTISIPCCRSKSTPGLGHETAAVVVHYLLSAATGVLEPGKFGVGPLKSNGFHGNDADMFYIHNPEDAAQDWWNPQVNTFVPMRTFCKNSHKVRTTRTGAIQCKCHGHPLDPELPQAADPLRYADGTRMATRVRAQDFITRMRRAAQHIFDSLPSDVHEVLYGLSLIHI